jgi:hypothetical protein
LTPKAFSWKQTGVVEELLMAVSDWNSGHEERTRALGIHYLDTRPAFEGRRASDFWIYELDPHPNATAHAGFAEVVVDYLVASGHLPPPPAR